MVDIFLYLKSRMYINLMIYLLSAEKRECVYSEIADSANLEWHVMYEQNQGCLVLNFLWRSH